MIKEIAKDVSGTNDPSKKQNPWHLILRHPTFQIVKHRRKQSQTQFFYFLRQSLKPKVPRLY